MSLLKADGTPSEYGKKMIEMPFVWAQQNADRKKYILEHLAEGIQKTIGEAIIERIRVSFDTDSFRKLTRKDMWRMNMSLNIPVSLIMEIIDGLEAEVKAVESREGTTGAGEAPLPPLYGGTVEPNSGESGIREGS